MGTFKELVWAGGALCCVMFALDISMPPDRGDTDQAIIGTAAPNSPAEPDAGTATGGSPSATEEPHNAQAEAAAVALPSAKQAVAGFENDPDQKHAPPQKRDVRRGRPKSGGHRVATARPAPPRTWNDNSWSWNQSWQIRPDSDSRTSAALPYPGRSAGYLSENSWNLYRSR